MVCMSACLVLGEVSCQLQYWMSKILCDIMALSLEQGEPIGSHLDQHSSHFNGWVKSYSISQKMYAKWGKMGIKHVYIHYILYTTPILMF